MLSSIVYVVMVYCPKVSSSAVALQVNVTQLIAGHSSYLWVTQKILEQLELDNYFAVYRSGHENPREEKSTVN